MDTSAAKEAAGFDLGEQKANVNRARRLALAKAVRYKKPAKKRAAGGGQEEGEGAEDVGGGGGKRVRREEGTAPPTGDWAGLMGMMQANAKKQNT